MRNLRTLVVALAFVATPCLAAGQDPPTGGQEPPQGGGRGGLAAEPEIRPYERVITAEAKSDDGVFRVHRIKDRVYYEIPKSALGREFLWVSQIAKTTLGAGYGRRCRCLTTSWDVWSSTWPHTRSDTRSAFSTT